MAYARAPKTGAWRGQSRRGVPGGGLGALGAWSTPAGGNPVVYLVAQVNRFLTPEARGKFGLQATVDQYPLPLATGQLELGPALYAVLVNQRRAADALARFQDQASEDAVTAADRGFADPVGFVTANLDALNEQLTIYGDMNHLPAAVGVVSPGITGMVSRLFSPPILIAVGVAAFFLLRKGR